AEMFKKASHSLVQGIQAAETACHGRAVTAHCCMGERGKAPAGQHPPRQPPRGRNTTGGGSDPQVICVVTCLVDNNRLVEVRVDSSNGRVLDQRDVATTGAMATQTDLLRPSGIGD